MSSGALFLSCVGAATLVVVLARVVRFAHSHLLASYSYAGYASRWAVVTGASSGIGAGFVHRLASRKINVILLARSESKMETLARSIESKYGVSTLVIPFDFSTATSSSYASLSAQLASLAPEILINNVGVNVEMPTCFADMPNELVDRIVAVNIASINRMTALLLPHMRAARRGVVVNMSSGGGALTPAPLLAVYAGTKAYADAFAVALSGELDHEGITVCSMTPFFVESAMAKMRKSFSVPSAEQFAECALRQVACGPSVNPYWVHAVMAAALGLLPAKTQVTKIADLHRSIRKRALRKKERLAKKN